MPNRFGRFLFRHGWLTGALLTSLASLLIFFFLQDNDAKLLQLEVKWILLSGAPTVLALILGGYIKTFKGFGIELETELKSPLPQGLISKISFVGTPALNKESLDQLRQLSAAERAQIKSLRFVNGKLRYYDTYAAQEHLRKLPNLRFLEVVDNEGRFLFLLSATSSPRKQGVLSKDTETIGLFIRALESKAVGKAFPSAVSDFISEEDSIIEAYRKLVRSEQARRLNPTDEELPVLDKTGSMIGTASMSSITKRIAEEVDQKIS